MNYRLLVMLFSGVISLKCTAQKNTFSLCAKLGFGGSAFPLHAILDANGRIEGVLAGTTVITGTFGQYMISDAIGIESGVYIAHYSYYWKDEGHLWRKRI